MPENNSTPADDDDYGQDESGAPEPKLQPTELTPEALEAIAAEFERMKHRRTET